MVKILGFNGKIIIAILYVYYCDINADVWPTRPSNSEYRGGRRVQTPKKKSVSEAKNENGQLRTESDKSTWSSESEIENNPPKHDSAQIEPILRNFNDPDSDLDSDSDKNTNRYKYFVKDWIGDKDRYHNPDNDHKTNRKHTTTKDKSHSIVKRHNRNSDPTTPTNHDMGKTHVRKRSSSGTKDHNTDRNSKKNKDHNTNKNKDKNHMRDKNHNVRKNQRIDRTQNEDVSSKMKESHENDHTSKKYPKKERHRDKSHDKDAKLKESLRIRKLHPEPLQELKLGLEKTTKKPTTQHDRSKLRTHTPTDGKHIQSTRMTQMYLMNQDDPDGNQNLQDSVHVPMSLSPYSLESQMTRILNEFSEANATIEHIGRTVEYNDIILLKITEKKTDMGKYFRAEESKYIDEVPEKKIILIVHGLSVMGMGQLACLNTDNNFKILLSYYLAHLQKFDIFLIPMANPDGYSASHSLSVWNKNTSPQEACAGVMLDRNFDVAWNGSRQVSSCSQLYPGAAPFSEVETKAIRDVFHYHGHKILAYIHVHAGTYTNKVYKGDAILYPRGYSESQSDDDKYVDLKGEIDEAMKNASFQVLSVTVDTLFNWYGRVTGSSVDYASSVYGIPYALEFVMQLYDGGDDEHQMEHYALTEIWSRLIDTTFNNMWKSLHTNEVRRK